MFDAIVPEYDRFNRLSSLGQDISWRREVASMFSGGSYILDVGTGTGDLAKELALKKNRVLGVDFSFNMISAARSKLKGFPLASFELASAQDLPFEPHTFDGLTSAFVIRNLHHGGVLYEAFREFYRVLKVGGQMVHLELTQPPQGILSIGHKAYMKMVLPIIGWLHFRDRWPQDYLAKTIQSFPPSKTICQQMRWLGFDRVGYYPLSGGVAGLFVGRKC